MLVDCPECKKKGHLILEKPRKRNETKQLKRRSNTVLHGLGDWKNTEYSLIHRIPGRYFRVHHYLTDKNGYYVRGKSGRPKSKFCYIGNFELALKKLKNIKTVLGQYATSKPTNHSKENRWLIWNSDDLQYMEEMYKQGKKIDLENLKPDDVNVIHTIIGDTKIWMIIDHEVLCKYA